MTKGFSIRPYGERLKLVPILMVVFSMLLFAVTCSFFIENIAFFQTKWDALMSDTQFFISFAAAFASGVLYLALAKRYFNVGLHGGFFLLFFTLFVCNCAGLFLYPLTSTYTGLEGATVTQTFTNMERVRFALDSFIVNFLFYALFAVAPKTIPSKRLLSLVHYLMVGFAISMIVYSLFREWDMYAAYFDPTHPFDTAPRTMSYTNNCNTYGYALMCAIISCAYLHSRNRWPLIWWVLMLAFFTAMLTTLSRTSIFATAIFLAFYFIHNVIRNIKHSPGRVVFSILILIGMIVAYFLLKKFLPADNFIIRFTDNILHRGLGAYDSRIDIWNCEIAILNQDPIRWAFGLGEKQAWIINGSLAPGLTYFCPSHNALLNQVFCGGIVRLVLFFALLGYIFYKGFSTRTRSKVIPLCMGAIICMMIHGLGEDTSFLNGESKAYLMFLSIVLPILVENHLDGHKEEIKAYRASAVLPLRKPAYVFSPIVRARLAFAFILLPVITIVGGLPLLQQEGHFLRYDMYQILAIGGGALFFFPICVYCIGFFRARGLRNFLTVLATLVFLGLAVPPLFFAGNWIYTGVTLGAMAVFTFLPFLFTGAGIFAAKEGFWKRVFLPYFLLVLVFYAPYALVYNLSSGATTYTLVAMLIMEAYALAIFFMTPLGRKLLYPIPYQRLLLDAKIMARIFRNEDKLDARDKRFYEGKPKAIKIHRAVYEVHTGGAKKTINPASRPYLRNRRD